MKTVVLVVLVCVIRLIESTRQSWDFPTCDAIAKYENNTLKLEKICDTDSAGRDTLYTFFLYRSDEKNKQCQWVKIHRQYFSLCEIQNTLAQGKVQAVFEHIYGGAYCLAIYNGKWTSNLPVCKTEAFNLRAKSLELDVKLWNPKLVVEQQGLNSLLIHLVVNNSDGYQFKNFLIEIYKFNEDIGDCDLLPHEYDQHFEITVSRFPVEFTHGNITEGYYCVQITPDDPRCILPHSVTNLPCTRTKLIRITKVHWILLFGAILSLFAVVVLVYLKKKKSRKDKAKDKTNEDSERLLLSIFLLHSNEEQIQSHVQGLKKTLLEKLSSCEIDDYTDPHQWENVAEEDINWFLIRLNQKDNYIIVIPHIFNAKESSENSNFLIALKQLQKLASTPDYQRVLIVCFQNSANECKSNYWAETRHPFHSFQLPKDLDLLINTLKGNVIST